MTSLELLTRDLAMLHWNAHRAIYKQYTGQGCVDQLDLIIRTVNRMAETAGIELPEYSPTGIPDSVPAEGGAK